MESSVKKTVCIYHSIDLDGWMSAAIVKLWGKDQPPIEFIGYNYGQTPSDVSEYDKVIMCDISFQKDEMEKLFDRLGENLIWVDHHISAIKSMFTEGERSIHPLGLQDTKFAACELTWQYFFPSEPMPEIVRLLGRYDCFGHKGTPEEKQVLEFQYAARTYIKNYEEAYHYLTFFDQDKVLYDWRNIGIGIYKFLCTEAKQSYKNGFKVTYADTKWIVINKERFNPVNFDIDYHAEGYDVAACFYFNGSKWSFSLYNDNGKVDVSQICKQFGGGGHAGAAGFVMDDISEFFRIQSNN